MNFAVSSRGPVVSPRGAHCSSRAEVAALRQAFWRERFAAPNIGLLSRRGDAAETPFRRPACRPACCAGDESFPQLGVVRRRDDTAATAVWSEMEGAPSSTTCPRRRVPAPGVGVNGRATRRGPCPRGRRSSGCTRGNRGPGAPARGAGRTGGSRVPSRRQTRPSHDDRR